MVTSLVTTGLTGVGGRRNSVVSGYKSTEQSNQTDDAGLSSICFSKLGERKNLLQPTSFSTPIPRLLK